MAHYRRRTATGEHKYRAEWIDGKGIRVVDEHGNEVKPSYGATADGGTTTAYLDNVGYIGGWTTQRRRPRPKVNFRTLVASINCGIVYHSTNDMGRWPIIGHKRG